MKCILVLTRDGAESNHQFNALTSKEAEKKAEKLIHKEWEERQRAFPHTREFPSNAILFREVRAWSGWKAK
jgi:hypothetical protein